MRHSRAFTLVEILIVVVLLAILAALVIPHIANYGDDARRNTLRSSVQIIRKQIQHFQIDHGHLPGDTSPGLDGSSFDADKFVSDLTATSTINGRSVGPYLSEFPPNPYVAPAEARKIAIGGERPAGGAGWWFDPARSRIEALAIDPGELDLDD